MNSLGVYFGSRAIDIVVIEGRKIANNARIPLASISNGELEERVSGVSKTIETVALFKEAFRKNKIEAKAATLCLSGRDLIIRTFEMPGFLSQNELAAAVSFEAKKYIPFKIEELITGYQALFDRISRKNLILFMGIKKEVMDTYLAIFKQLNIKLNLIEYAGFSITRVLKLTGIKDKGVIAMLCVDHQCEDEINFTILDNDFPLFSRDITLIAGLEADRKTEEARKQDVVLEKLKSEIRVSLDYYNRKFPDRKIQKMFLLCAKDYQPQIESSIVDLGLIVKFIDVANLVQGPVVYSSGFIKAYASSLSRVIRTKIEIDLLTIPEKAVGEKTAAAELTSLVTGLKFDFKIIIVALFICLASFGFGVFRIQPAQKELDNIKGNRIKIGTVSPESSYEELSAAASAYLKKIEEMDKLIKKQPYLTKPLDAIPRAIPDGLWLTRFSFNQKENKKELILQGAVYLGNAEEEFLAVRQFLSNLKGNRNFSGFFKSINISSMEQKEEADKKFRTNFLITCND